MLLAGAGKVFGGYVGARSAGVNRRTALATGAGLNARGMVEILIASIGLKAGLLTEAMYSILVGIAVLTSIVTPILLRLILPDEVVVEPNGRRAGRPRTRHGARTAVQPA